jgi:hypothetical protein
LKFLTFTRQSALFTWLLLSGCNQILDIQVQKVTKNDDAEDGGVVEEDAGQDAGEELVDKPSKQDCNEYCDVLDKACDPTGPNAAFRERGYCDGLCSFMGRTESKAQTGNTFDCRLNRAKLARTVGTSDNSAECRSAGAGGNGECGSNCEGYCQLFKDACAAYPDLQRGETCIAECDALSIDSTKNAAAAFTMGADTLQCRLAHLGAASVDPTLAKTHCAHAAIHAQPGTPCQPTTPSCDDYCALITKACTGKLQQYDTELDPQGNTRTPDCLATCRMGLTLTEPLAADEASDQTHDTVACRRYHVYNALKAPGSTHCEHGGPSGDGHCGRICPAYCKLTKAACGAQFNAKFPTEQACINDCSELIHIPNIPDQIDQHFSVANGKKAGTINCRIYHATKAFRAATAECPSALGDGDCAP